MKSQDILLMLKLVSLKAAERDEARRHEQAESVLDEANEYLDWQGWENTPEAIAEEPAAWELYSVRSLSALLGISKSEISASLNRGLEVGLISKDQASSAYRANTKALLGIIEHAVPYFFPARLGAVARGIPTTFAAPALKGKLMSVGDLPPVWPDARGNVRGQSVVPLYKSVPLAVRKDRRLYSWLALVDAARLGAPRERRLAMDTLQGMLES
ncbi:MAG: hypothetical protein ACK4SX_10780 [Alcanivoracaceae bacterium]